MENSSSIKLFRIISLIIVILALIGSLGFMFYAGRQNRSVILILLFTGWVSSPFLVLLIGYFSKRWPGSRRMHLYILMNVIAFLSLIVYSGAFGIHGPHPAFVFMIIPLVSWILIGIIWLMASKLKR